RPRSTTATRFPYTTLFRSGQRRHTPCRGKEAHQPPPESECIPFAVAGEKVFRHTFSHRFLMWRIYFKQIALAMRVPAIIGIAGASFFKNLYLISQFHFYNFLACFLCQFIHKCNFFWSFV